MMNARATFICGGELVPASRFRVHPIAQGLGAEGWQTRVIHGYGPRDQKIRHPILRRAYRAGCRVMRAAKTAASNIDGPVMVQRLAWPWWAAPEARLARRCSGLVFDFDDAVFLGEGGRPSVSRKRAMSRVFAASRHVVAGNSWLAEMVDADVPITVLPTCIDTSVYVPRHDAARTARQAIGWIGTSGNYPYLEQLVEPLARLRKSGREFDFRICSDIESTELCRKLDAKFERWTADGEIPFLQSLDIGLMPLEDNDWCRGKCSFKLIQYMAVGCPVIASPIGFNRDVVLDGEVGFLVDKDDWVSPIESLLDSDAVRRKFSIAARRRSVENFDVSIAIAAYRKILGELQ